MYECAIADFFYKKGYKLYFYKNETGKKELDFVLQKDGKPIPIEVKCRNSKGRALRSFLEEHGELQGYRFTEGNLHISDEGIICLPMYMAGLI